MAEKDSKEKHNQLRDEILKKMLETPPKPNKPLKEKESDKGKK
jgi:hypothetical protein